LTIVTVLAGCGEADDAGGGGTPAGEPITLSVGIDSVYAPMFLAAAEELFADEGIRVELRQFVQGGEGVDAMLAGEIDVAASADSTFLVRAARTDIAVLGPYVEDDGDYVKLVTRQEIGDAGQIERIGVIPGQISDTAPRSCWRRRASTPSPWRWSRSRARPRCRRCSSAATWMPSCSTSLGPPVQRSRAPRC